MKHKKEEGDYGRQMRLYRYAFISLAFQITVL